MSARTLRSVATATVAALTLALGVALVGGPGTAPVSAAPAAAKERAPYMTLKVGSVKISAPVYKSGVTDRTMDVPDAPSRLGWLDKSAQFGDLIGDIVVAGHVSDNSDRPGALYRLKNVKKGAIVTITKGGETRKFKVVSKRTYSRDAKLPESMFETDGKSSLVIVTCANKITYPDGSFHYRDNLVVSAVAIN